MSYALVAAALMDLAFVGRIDTDAKRFMIVDLKPTHNSIAKPGVVHRAPTRMAHNRRRPQD